MWRVIKFVDTFSQRSRWPRNRCPFRPNCIAKITYRLYLHTATLLFFPSFNVFETMQTPVGLILWSVDGWHPATLGRSRSRQNFTDSSSDSGRLQLRSRLRIRSPACKYSLFSLHSQRASLSTVQRLSISGHRLPKRGWLSAFKDQGWNWCDANVIWLRCEYLNVSCERRLISMDKFHVMGFSPEN